MIKKLLPKTSKFNNVFTFSLIASLFIVSSIVYADITINDDGNITYYKGEKAANVEGNSITISDLSTKKATGINHQNKVHYETSLNEFTKEFIGYMKGMQERQKKAMMAKTGQTEEEYDAMMKKQMQMMQGMFGGMQQQFEAMKIETKKEGTEKLAGYKCDKYVITNHGRPVQIVWVSPAVDALIDKELGPRAAKEMKKMKKEFESEIEKVRTQMMKDMGMDESMMEDPIDNARTEIEEKGYLMMSQEMDGMFGGMDQHEEPVCNVIISKSKIDDSIFKVPNGYNKVTVKEFLIMQEQHDMDEDMEGMDEEMTDEDAKAMAEFFDKMKSEDTKSDKKDASSKKVNIHDIKVCAAGYGKSLKLDFSKEGEREPTELDAILKKNTQMGFKFQDIQTCSYIPLTKLFGVKVGGSCGQGALFYKGDKECIQVFLNISKDKADEGSSIEGFYKMNPAAGGKPEKTKIQGYETIYATFADFTGVTNQRVEIMIGEHASLLVILVNENGNDNFSIKLVDWVNKALNLSKYKDPDWF